MLSHGDELGRSQQGNNNAYCHDSPLNWLDWDLDQRRLALLSFTQRLFRIRRSNPVFRRRSFFGGDPVDEAGSKDVQWLRPDGAVLLVTAEADVRHHRVLEVWSDLRKHIADVKLGARPSDDEPDQPEGER